MKNLRSIIIGLGSVTAFLSITIFPISKHVQAPTLSWTRNVSVVIGPTLLRAAAIVLVTLLVAYFIPKKK